MHRAGGDWSLAPSYPTSKAWSVSCCWGLETAWHLAFQGVIIPWLLTHHVPVSYDKTTLSRLNIVSLHSFKTKAMLPLESCRIKKIKCVIQLRVLWKTTFKKFYCSDMFICMYFNVIFLFYFICEISSALEIEAPPSATSRKHCEERFECVNWDPLSGSAYSFWQTLGWQVDTSSGIHCILMILL